mgnify:FL=1
MNKREKIKVVAFDFFDTVVSRKVNPEVILAEWSRNVCIRFCLNETPKELLARRKSIERSIKATGIEEPQYRDLIEAVYRELVRDRIMDQTILYETFYEIVSNIEFKIELYYTEPIEERINLVRHYKNEDKMIIIISDFYLPKQYYLEFLRYKKLDTLFDEVYVSSELNARKSSGSLYEFVLNSINIMPEELLMIGDNKISDEIIPSKKGIFTLRVPQAEKYPLYSKKHIVKKLVNITKKNYKDQPFNGYIPGLLLFIERLYKNVLNDGCNNLLFFAREGENLKKLFDTYQNIIHPTMTIKTQYVYVSRRATLLPSLENLKTEDFSKVFSQYPSIAIGDFLYSIGFSKEESRKLLDTLEIEPTKLVNGINDATFKKVRSFKDFTSLYEKKRIEQRRLLKYYLSEFTDNNKYIYIVDIGWKGSIQDNIYDALEGKVQIKGYYWGTINATNVQNNEKKGLMFSDDRKKMQEEIFSYNHIELEKIFAASHGQTLAYERKANSIKAIISDKKSDVEIYQYVRDWQNKMNDYFIEACNYIKNSYYDIESLERLLAKMYLYHQCVNVPFNRNIYLNFRTKAKENFGNISGIKIKMDKNNLNDINQKRKFGYVDYSYKLLDKFHLKALSPVAALYSRMVYKILIIRLLNKTSR